MISNTTISGLTFTGGNTPYDNGGGGYVTGRAQPTLGNVSITNNFTAYNGGGLFNATTITLTNSIVAFNTAFGVSGGCGLKHWPFRKNHLNKNTYMKKHSN